MRTSAECLEKAREMVALAEQCEGEARALLLNIAGLWMALERARAWQTNVAGYAASARRVS